MRNHRLLWVLFIGIVLVIWLGFTRGVLVIVTNQGPDTLRDMTVHVTGNSYDIGNLLPGESKRVRVSPTGESGVQVEFTDEQGKRIHSKEVGYFEPGYRGAVHLYLKDGRIENVEGQPLPSIY